MILENLFGRRQSLAYRSGSWPVSQTPGVLFAGPESAAGVRVDADGALSLSAVFAGVNFLSRVLASLPLNVYRRRADGGKELGLSHRAQRLLHSQPNPEMTASTFRRVLEWHRLLGGNAYAEVVWDGGGNPASLWPLESWRVKTKREKSGALYYLVDGKRKVAPADMLHVPLVSWDGVSGRSFLDYALDSLGLGIGAQDFAARFFGNDARPGGLLEHPGNPPQKARDEMKAGWQRKHGGSSKAHVLGLLWGGWKWNKDAGGIPPDEAQLLETRKFTTEEVARWLNLPPTFLADLSRATFGNIEEQGINLVVYSVGPVLVDYEQEYDRKLLGPPGLYAKHNLGALLRGDAAARATYYKDLFGIGVYSVNDVLEMEDRNPVGPDGDKRFVPANMVTLDKAGLPLPDNTPPEDVPPEEDPNADPGEAPPKGVLPPDDAEGTAARIGAAHQSLVRCLLAQGLRREAAAAVRAAERPAKFLAWMDGFYPDQEKLAREMLTPAFVAWHEAAPTPTPPEVRAAALAAESAGESKRLLLAAAECQAKALPERVAACTGLWEQRAMDPTLFRPRKVREVEHGEDGRVKRLIDIGE